MLEQVEVGQLIQDLKMNVLQAIQYIIQSWDEISADTIQNCWNHTEILPNTFPLYDIYEDNIDDELEDQIISEIAKLFKSGLDVDHSDEIDDSTEG
ncbi:hypothetical protein GLOIN_2v1479386 [Rhizophagus irregularis DAOM 181602=DAOM 197198]|nr:hypothetical protein GLOIN_2v1479386 [Rhizophagus irregularis DAOM 181602=DAOM 197198]